MLKYSTKPLWKSISPSFNALINCKFILTKTLFRSIAWINSFLLLYRKTEGKKEYLILANVREIKTAEAVNNYIQNEKSTLPKDTVSVKAIEIHPLLNPNFRLQASSQGSSSNQNPSNFMGGNFFGNSKTLTEQEIEQNNKKQEADALLSRKELEAQKRTDEIINGKPGLVKQLLSFCKHIGSETNRVDRCIDSYFPDKNQIVDAAKSNPNINRIFQEAMMRAEAC